MPPTSTSVREAVADHTVHRSVPAVGRAVRRGDRRRRHDRDARAGAVAVPDGELGLGPARIGLAVRRRRGGVDVLHPVYGRHGRIDRQPAADDDRPRAGRPPAAAARPGDELRVRDRLLRDRAPLAIALLVTPSLAYMAEATSSAGASRSASATACTTSAWAWGCWRSGARRLALRTHGLRLADARLGAGRCCSVVALAAEARYNRNARPHRRSIA